MKETDKLSDRRGILIFPPQLGALGELSVMQGRSEELQYNWLNQFGSTLRG